MMTFCIDVSLINPCGLVWRFIIPCSDDRLSKFNVSTSAAEALDDKRVGKPSTVVEVRK